MKPTHGAHTSNTYIGTPIERVEDQRFLRGDGQYVDDLSREGHAARRHPAQPGRAWPDPLDRRLDGAARCPASVRSSPPTTSRARSRPSRSAQPNPTIEPYEQPVIARDKVRYVGEPVAVVLADARACRGRTAGRRGRHRAAAGGHRLRERDGGQVAAVRRHRLQPRVDLQRRQGRRRRGVRQAPTT